METPPTHDQLVHRYVLPYYMSLLGGHWQYLPDEERNRWLADFHAAAEELPDHVAVDLLDSMGWRPRLTVACMVGATGRVRFTQMLSDRIVPSTMCYAAQGCCAALAMFATPHAADALCAYLETYLHRIDLFWDQTFAYSALVHIDDVNGTDRHTVFEARWHRLSRAQALHHETGPDEPPRFVSEAIAALGPIQRRPDVTSSGSWAPPSQRRPLALASATDRPRGVCRRVCSAR